MFFFLIFLYSEKMAAPVKKNANARLSKTEIKLNVSKIMNKFQASSLCMQLNCSQDTVNAVKKELQKDLFTLMTKHNEVTEMMSLALKKDKDLERMFELVCSLLSKPEFRSDIATYLTKYNEVVLKPAASKESVEKVVSCMRDHGCSVDDYRKIVQATLCVLEFGMDPAISKAYKEMIKTQENLFINFLAATKK